MSKIYSLKLSSPGKLFLMLLGFVVLGAISSQAQTVPCPPNVDFEQGNYGMWTYEVGYGNDGGALDTNGAIFKYTAPFSGGGGGFITPPATNPNPAPWAGPVQPLTTGIRNPGQPIWSRFDTTTNTIAPADTDYYGGFKINPPGGGSYAIKIGSDTANYCAERMTYYVHVPIGSNDYSFNYRFAVVLYDGGHPLNQQPNFRVDVLDSASNTPLVCATQSFVAKASIQSVYGFGLSPKSQPPYLNYFYLPWTGGAIPIIGQSGKTITIQVTASGCSQGGHWAYGYFDVVSCGTYKASVSYCKMDSGIVRFVGTGITQTYNWYDQNWNFVGKGPYVDVQIPNTPTRYIGVLANGVVGCLDTIYTDTIANFTINATPPTACAKFGNTIQLNTIVTGGVPGTFTYSWNGSPDLSSTSIPNPVASPRDTTSYVVTVSDKVGCYRTDTIHIEQAPDAGPDLKVCPLGERPAQLYVAGPNDVTYHWTALDGSPAQYLSCDTCRDPLSAPLEDPYTYLVGYAGCNVLDTITIFHDNSNGVVATDDLMLVCRPTYVDFHALPIGPNPRANIPCGTASPISCAPADQDTSIVGYSLTIPPARPVNTPFFSEYAYNKYQFIIPKSELIYNGFYSGTINSMAFKTLAATVAPNALQNMTISLACVNFTDFPQPATNTSFQNYGTPVATIASYTLTPNAWNTITFDTPYSWDTTKNLLVDVCMGYNSAPNAGGAGSDPIAMVPGHTIQKFSNTINVCGGDVPNVFSYIQRPVVKFIYCPTDTLPFKYTWTPGTYLNDSTTQNPRAYVTKTTQYAVNTIGLNGCRVVDTLHIKVPEHHLSVTPQDSAVCLHQPAFMNATGGDAYQWFEYAEGVFTDASGSLTCTDCQSPIATPGKTTTYAVVFTNDIGVANPFNDNASIGCPDTLFTTLRVLPLPGVYSTNKDTTIGYGKSVQLFARGASNYTWTPVGSLSDPNSPAPIARPRETTTYIVTGLDSNGCAARDTVKVTVVFTEHLQIPTGFTPNGDGRNDVFRVVNASYQRLMEFRVFNRWGQEIFSTTDINDGWDGTWKGVPQEIGTYQYIIRVGSPDGNVERYQGDVTLIR